MNIFDFERKAAFRDYKNKNYCRVELTLFIKERDGGSITTLFPDGNTIITEYNTRQEGDTIYFKVMEDEYEVKIKAMDELAITAFDLVKDGQVFDSFIIE